MPIHITDTRLPDVKILEPTVFRDERGFFMESWNALDFQSALRTNITFVQDNHSKSRRGVVRGLHYQLAPHAQAKLVRCLTGAVFDVAVDIRRRSPTFGQWVGVELSAENMRQLWIPEGFAHGFVALSETAEVLYKTNDYWHRECEAAIRWDDPDLDIQWPLTEGICLSEKDAMAPFLRDARPFS